MIWWKKSLAMLLVVLWVPLTMHCELESLPGFGFLQCCCGDAGSEKGPGDCTQDLCGDVEWGFCKVEDDLPVLPQLTLGLLFVQDEAVVDVVAELSPSLTPEADPPPELACFWQFSYRTALPPRAPSVVS